jgi:hypothetical protein
VEQEVLEGEEGEVEVEGVYDNDLYGSGEVEDDDSLDDSVNI